ncbi:MAG: D-2-hydroxyacid dehydrogenase [Acidimicrobiales bacterium]
MTPAESPSMVLIAPTGGLGLPGPETLRGWARRLRSELPEIEVVVAGDDDAALAALRHATAAYGTLPTAWSAPGLAWLQAPMAAPPVGYFTPELAAHPVVVTNMRGIYDDHIATHVMAYILALARGFPAHLAHQRDHSWRPEEVPTLHLPDATVLLVGAGGVGRQVAAYLRPFGPRVVAVDARPDRVDRENITRAVGPDELDGVLPLADVVVMTVPHTPDTEGMMDRARFQRMKDTAVLVNIGRGRTVKLDDLTEALATGVIAGAGLDVFEHEPLPADHRLWDLPNVLITPHSAMAGPYLDDRRYELIAGNARRYLAGEPLIHVVDKQQGF